MKPTLRTIIALSLPLIPACDSLAALNPAIVAADSQWVLHLDLNTLRASTLGKELIDTAMKMQPPIADGNVTIDFQKLLATIGSVTAYGTNFSEDPKLIDGTLIFEGTPDLRKIAEGFVAQATVTTPEKISELKDLPFETYSFEGQVFIGFPAEPIILVSKSKAQLLKAREVFRGAAPSLGKSSASPLRALLQQPANPYLVAASVVPSDSFIAIRNSGGPQARVLQMANSGSIALGEVNDQAFARVKLVASSEDMADKLMKVLQGMTALLSLAETNDQHLTEFLKSVKVAGADNAVTLDLAYNSDRLVQMIRNTQQQRQRQPSRPNRQQPARPAPAPVNHGNVVAEWTADQDLGSDTVTADNLVSRTIENVALTRGSTLTLTGRRNDGENARIDYVEISPSQGNAQAQPLHFDAESMHLSRYTVENSPFASGRKLITLSSNASSGTAQFQFPGADGLYTLTIRYVDESDGKGTFTVAVKDLEPVVEKK